jgi:triosephosphate isomerase
MARKIAAGNWKMNGLGADLAEIADLPPARCEVLICPPAPLISRASDLVRSDGRGVQIGGQDCHAKPSGAHTGDVSAAMLVDAGASHVILGHSERRQDHGETNETVRDKVSAALAVGLVPVVCLGETEEQRDRGETLAVVAVQLTQSLPDTVEPERLVIAYEPVWAIGTGRTPTEAQIVEVHRHLRAELGKLLGSGAQAVPLLYGGSVKPDNAAAIFALPEVDGALVGGASLRARDFGPIIVALSQSEG